MADSLDETLVDSSPHTTLSTYNLASSTAVCAIVLPAAICCMTWIRAHELAAGGHNGELFVMRPRAEAREDSFHALLGHRGGRVRWMAAVHGLLLSCANDGCALWNPRKPDADPVRRLPPNPDVALMVSLPC